MAAALDSSACGDDDALYVDSQRRSMCRAHELQRSLLAVFVADGVLLCASGVKPLHACACAEVQ